MPRHPFGPNLRTILERAPVQAARSFLGAPSGTSGPVVDLATLGPSVEKDDLVDFVSGLEQDVLKQLEDLSREVVDLSVGKGVTSLTTVVDRELQNTDIAVFQAQPDELCKSVWVFASFRNVFMDAQSFYKARRHREHGNLYSAFVVSGEGLAAFGSENVDEDELAKRVSKALDLKSKTSVVAIDLPKTATYPRSVMVAVRHGGVLSSIIDHRDDGLRETRYYRPGEEAILIYTPSQQKLEICARGYLVRETTSRTFAEVVLGQDLKKTPLTGRNFNLDRFRTSLRLPFPDFEDVEITQAKVTEIETRLGSWKRRLLLQVTADDDIEEFADRFMGTARTAAAHFGYSRVSIAVGYTYREGGESGTLKLWVSSGNTSNAPNDRDPKLRDLGVRLLEFWGIMEHLQLLEETERARYFENLLFLYDFPEDEMSGAGLSRGGVDRQRLISAKILEKKGRQDIVLIEDDNGSTEADVETGTHKGTLEVKGPFGEEAGTVPEDDYVIYRIDRPYLSEIIFDALRRELGARRAVVFSDFFADFGKVPIGSETIPVYLIRALDTHKKPEQLDLEFRRRHHAGPGLILSAGDTSIRYLGPNVVIPLHRVVSVEEDEIVLDPEALEHDFRAGQLLIMAGEAPQLIHHNPKHATLRIPGLPPFNFFAEKCILLFRRLVDANRAGERDVPTGRLMADMGSKSPQQLFSKADWQHLRDVYIERGEKKSWRLCEPHRCD